MSYEHEHFTVEHEGQQLTVRILTDEMSVGEGDPREWDNLGVMVCLHRRYELGDKPWRKHIPAYDEAESTLLELYRRFGKVRAFPRWARMYLGATTVLPVYMIDHSGLAMRTHSFRDIDPGEWDSGFVGFIFDTTETRDAMGVEEANENIPDYLNREVEVYSAWLRGDVVNYVIEKHEQCDLGYDHATIVGGVGGYIITGEEDMKYVRDEAEHEAKTYLMDLS